MPVCLSGVVKYWDKVKHENSHINKAITKDSLFAINRIEQKCFDAAHSDILYMDSGIMASG